jgi:hypothetical protein
VERLGALQLAKALQDRLEHIEDAIELPKRHAAKVGYRYRFVLDINSRSAAVSSGLYANVYFRSWHAVSKTTIDFLVVRASSAIVNLFVAVRHP